MAGAKFEPTFENVFIRMGLTHVLKRICSFLDTDDILILLHTYPELLKTSKCVLNDRMDAPHKHGLDIFKLVHQLNIDLARQIMQAKNLAAFKFIRNFRGNDFYDWDTIWRSESWRFEENVKTITPFMEKVIEENDFDTFIFINERFLHKIRLKEGAFVREGYVMVLSVDHVGYLKAADLQRLDMLLYYDRRVWGHILLNSDEVVKRPPKIPTRLF